MLIYVLIDVIIRNHKISMYNQYLKSNIYVIMNVIWNIIQIWIIIIVIILESILLIHNDLLCNVISDNF